MGERAIPLDKSTFCVPVHGYLHLPFADLGPRIALIVNDTDLWDIRCGLAVFDTLAGFICSNWRKVLILALAGIEGIIHDAGTMTSPSREKR